MVETIGQVIKELFSADRRKVFILFVVISSSTLLFLPQQALRFFGLQGFILTYRQWISLTFLLGVALLLAEVLVWGWSWGQDQLRLKKEKQQQVSVLHSLTREEYQLLRDYVNGRTQVKVIRFRDVIAQGLVHKGILYTAQQYDSNGSTGFYIQPWAYEYLSSHRELLGLKRDEP